MRPPGCGRNQSNDSKTETEFELWLQRTATYSTLLELLTQLDEVLGDFGGIAGRPRVVDGDRAGEAVQLGTELRHDVRRRHRLLAGDHTRRHVTPARFQPPHRRLHRLRRLLHCGARSTSHGRTVHRNQIIIITGPPFPVRLLRHDHTTIVSEISPVRAPWLLLLLLLNKCY